MNREDLIDGLHVIARRRGMKIQQGDVEIVEAAIKALAKPTPTPRAEVATPKGWPWIEGNMSIPVHIVQQCEVWTGTAGHAGIQTHYDNGEETPNRIALLKLNAELRALLNPPSMNNGE